MPRRMHKLLLLKEKNLNYTDHAKQKNKKQINLKMLHTKLFYRMVHTLLLIPPPFLLLLPYILSICFITKVWICKWKTLGVKK